MFGYPTMPRTLSLVRLLGGLSKTLNVANQVIPIYHKAKPMISNARTIMNTLKKINITDNTPKIQNEKKTIKKESNLDSPKQNNPKFFI